ncbi:hypothetical protein GX441_08465 [bacterium]|nr:hypothetical protein [bacterium]
MIEKKLKPEKSPKWLRVSGWVILAINALCMINAAWFFLALARFPFIGWIFFNACFVSSLIWIVGFIFKWRWMMMASLPFLLFFGGGGLFIFPWSGNMITAQVSHIAMMFALTYAIVDAFVTRGWKSKLIGLAGGIAVFAGFLIVQQDYAKKHPELWLKMGMQAPNAESGATRRYNK